MGTQRGQQRSSLGEQTGQPGQFLWVGQESLCLRSHVSHLGVQHWEGLPSAYLVLSVLLSPETPVSEERLL